MSTSLPVEKRSNMGSRTLFRVVKSSRLLAKIATYLVSIKNIPGLAFVFLFLLIILERFSYDLEKWFRQVFVICFISKWMKRSKHWLFVFPPEKTLIWRWHCLIGQSCCSMTSKQSIDWFLESSRAWSFFTRAFA